MAHSPDTDDAFIDRTPLDMFEESFRQAARETLANFPVPNLLDAFGVEPEKPEPVWNFTALGEIPMIRQPVEPLAIPETWIPSPFIPGLHPEHVESIQTRLAGNGDHNYGGSGSGFLDCGPGRSVGYNGLSGWTGTGPRALGNGKNIWDAWKRAFDLWNDYYIEGRLDTKEIGKELLAAEREWATRPRGSNTDSAEPNPADHPDSEDEYIREPHPYNSDIQTLKDAIEEQGPGMRGIKWVIPEPDPGTIRDGKRWHDPIQNTVWMPIICGETKPRFKWDINTERLTNLGEHKEYADLDEFALQGALDCSTMPTPVLRPIEKYGFYYRQNHRNRLGVQKIRLWDGVSNTVFNIPSRPFSEDPNSIPIDHIVQRAYRTRRDELEIEGSPPYFPLNIRRVEKMHQPKDEITNPVLIRDLEGSDRAQVLLNRTGSNSIRSHTPLHIPSMTPADPWYITPEEQHLRSSIDRSLPENDPLSTTRRLDQKHYEYELHRDDHLHAGYFVTNLDGRTLIINGLEILRGQVAGPLPDFAIIECPGGNIVFWWGPDGRNKGIEVGDIDYETIKKAWITKRNDDPKWKHVGRTRRSVWRSMIREKMKKGEEPDLEWADWREQARKDEQLGLRGGAGSEEEALDSARRFLSKRRRGSHDDNTHPKRPKRRLNRPLAMQATQSGTGLPSPPPPTGLPADIQKAIDDLNKHYFQTLHQNSAKQHIENSMYDFVNIPKDLGMRLDEYQNTIAQSYNYRNWKDLVRKTGLDESKIPGLQLKAGQTAVQRGRGGRKLTKAEQQTKDAVESALRNQESYAADLGTDYNGLRQYLAENNGYKTWDEMVKKLGIVDGNDTSNLPTDIASELYYGVGYWEDRAQSKGVSLEHYKLYRAVQFGYRDFEDVVTKLGRRITEPPNDLLKSIIASRRPFFSTEAIAKRVPLSMYKDNVARLYGFQDWDDCEIKLFGTLQDGDLLYIPPPADAEPELAALFQQEYKAARIARKTIFTHMETRYLEMDLMKREFGKAFLPRQQDGVGNWFCEL